MNSMFCKLVFLLIGAASMASAQFEGVIDMKSTSNDRGKPHEMAFSMSVKKDMIATDIKNPEKEMGGGKFIYRGDKKLLWIINDKEKNYMEMSLKDRDDADAEKKPGKKPKSSKSTVRKSGKTQTILGYSCDEWISEDEEGSTSIWGTAKLGNVYEGLSKSLGQMGGGNKRHELQGWEGDLAGMNIFPLKIVRSKEGKIKDTQEVTKIEAKTLAASLFEAPSGYEKQSFDMDMMKMMKDMQKKMMEKMEKKKDKKDGDEGKDEDKDDDKDDDDHE